MKTADNPATVSSMLQEAAARFPANSAVIAGALRLSYAELRSAISALSRELALAGVPGGRVAVAMGNGAAIVIALYAVWQAGAQVVPLNPDYTERELGEILDDANVRAIVCGPAQKERLGVFFAGSGRAQVFVLDDAGVPALVDEGETAEGPFPDPDSLAILQYTGGTTGRSKGVMLTHRMVATNVLQRDEIIPMVHGAERILCVTPLYHAL